MSKIVVVGGVNMDIHLFDVRASSGQAPLLADHYVAEPGGKGGNVARAAARLGAEVRLVARAGDDEFGRSCVEAIDADGVDTSAVMVTPGVPTGFVAIELDGGKHRSVLFASGANDHLTWLDVEPALAGLVAGDMVIAQAEIPAAVLVELARHLVASPATFLLDPTPPDQVTAEVLVAADVITPNLVETAALVGRTDSSPLWARIAARELVELGARRAIVKCGEDGAVLAAPDEVSVVPTLTVEARDETGAGDVFLAALAVRRSEGADWAEATVFANVASALSVAETGLWLPDRAAIDQARSSGGR